MCIFKNIQWSIAQLERALRDATVDLRSTSLIDSQNGSRDQKLECPGEGSGGGHRPEVHDSRMPAWIPMWRTGACAYTERVSASAQLEVAGGSCVELRNGRTRARNQLPAIVRFDSREWMKIGGQQRRPARL
ncbi:hypothetical protein MPTK1_5g01390 [Marchantia polymorpha subsp. ruderalis]|uniref:Uncharacterized protein n=2 Tax=Marchantia polymorpha TaxID=3197 RepID=A0AAF6BDS5_MARPO|nr:hypothetical protein MARPO_0175s0002 [Marchantia polymorpha]BBN10159.1 hypothetical protein Mp_5g01390 [Marchantia polymorpha subsp. ruderalis]|eukprot:PTQ28037.1 hypothetical protein MARPO_0175s0002 [Marchantia polymorpha]